MSQEIISINITHLETAIQSHKELAGTVSSLVGFFRLVCLQMKTPTIDSFFKRKTKEISEKDCHVHSEEYHAPKLRRLEIDYAFDNNKLERDPGLWPQIWKYPIGKRDEVRRAYINFGPYQPMLDEYPKSIEKQSRSS
ncbi:hypothetical protein QQ045_020961 [Rhodiola kirilowii]